ncbi:MAG: serine/threonine-protein kinase [Nannocystaceae bacterium]
MVGPGAQGDSDEEKDSDIEHSPTVTLGANRERRVLSRKHGALLEGQLLDNRYTIERLAGWGGMGAVYVAEDAHLQRKVALKVIHSDAAADPGLCRLFLQEAECMAQVRHPNVLEIYDVGQDGTRPYLVMPLVHGKSLSQWTRARGGPPVPVDVMVGILGQACAGVEAIHEQGLVHGDLKARNILVSDSLQVLVGDLGLARRVSPGSRFSVLGATPGYVAPELILNDDVPSEHAFRIDVYALAVVAYWLLAGRMPAGRGSAEEVMHRQLDHDPPPPSELRPELPLAFDGPLLRALHRDPRERSTLADLRESLFGARIEAARQRPRERPFVVVVDDDPAALALTHKVLHELVDGLEIACFGDPIAARSLLESRPPDMVITDLAMDGLNGVELIASLRGRPSTRDIPVVVLTAAGDSADWALLRELGTRHFLVKPLDAAMLGYAVRHALRRFVGPPGREV